MTVILTPLYLYTKTFEVFWFIGWLIFIFIIYYFFSHLSHNSRKYKIIFKLVLGVTFLFVLYLPLKYIFIFIHEISHVAMAIFLGIRISDFQINVNGISYVDFPYVLEGLEASLMSIAGSMGVLIVGIFLILLLLQNRKIKIEIYIPLMALISWSVLYNIGYWIVGIRDGFGDVWALIDNNPSIHPVHLLITCTIIYDVTFFVLILLSILKLWIMTKNYFIEVLPDLSLFSFHSELRSKF
ncbi:MAG: M50 family metallopeptidase [Candidatus Thorarchaeota archaeon]